MPAIPRPASTVVLVDDEMKVFLTKRPDTMKFLGGYYVFPGGAVETVDDIHDPNLLNTFTFDTSFELSHYIAAIRELFEEVGIFLGGSKDGTALFKKKSDLEYRRLLVSGEISLIELLEDESLELHFHKLQYFGHFITPERSPIRFDTRFFLATLPKGQEPQPDPNEIDEAFWISPKEALELYDQGKIPMVPPTVISLKGIYDYQQGYPLKMPTIHDFKIKFNPF